MSYDSNDRYDGVIKYCPRCKSEADVCLYSPSSFLRIRRYYIRCDVCGLMNTPIYETPKGAIDNWNMEYKSMTRNTR